MAKAINLPDAFDDPNLFGPFFKGPSWDAWRAIIRAAHALPMTPEQLITFGQLAGGRAPPKRKVRELWIAAGRRAGKDSLASAFATVASLQTYEGLRPGEPPTILCLACDKPQAQDHPALHPGLFRSHRTAAGPCRARDAGRLRAHERRRDSGPVEQLPQR